MLPRDHRLRSTREFQQVYRGGRSWAHPLAALHVHPRPSGLRMGIAVSKKVGKAVVRNRVRRRLREIVRALLPEWKQGFDAVLVARSAAAEAEFAELEAAVRELARRARLPREPDAAPDALYIMPAGAPGHRRPR
ncbi:MAG: ribonuclease P protein component [Armatimonadota bacterium]